jgi:hypothetical protein
MSMNTLSLSNVVVGEDLQKSLDKEGLKSYRGCSTCLTL